MKLIIGLLEAAWDGLWEGRLWQLRTQVQGPLLEL